jgi:hypothetical protein
MRAGQPIGRTTFALAWEVERQLRRSIASSIRGGTPCGNSRTVSLRSNEGGDNDFTPLSNPL